MSTQNNGPTAYDIQRNSVSEARRIASQAVTPLYAAFKIIEVTTFGNPSLEAEATRELLDLTDPLYQLIQRARQRIGGRPMVVTDDHKNG